MPTASPFALVLGGNTLWYVYLYEFTHVALFSQTQPFPPRFVHGPVLVADEEATAVAHIPQFVGEPGVPTLQEKATYQLYVHCVAPRYQLSTVLICWQPVKLAGEQPAHTCQAGKMTPAEAKSANRIFEREKWRMPRVPLFNIG